MIPLRIIICILFVSISTLLAGAKTVYDLPDGIVHELFSTRNVKYVIRYEHKFRDTLRVPSGSEILFDGGQLSGPIVFNDTKLSGTVNLKGASIGGTVSNKVFDASWLCSMNGVTDDAKSINEMIESCGNVFFPKGTYRLVSHYNPEGKVPENLHRAIKAHIGICRSNVELIGERGTNFITDDSLGTICIFSKPNNIRGSIRDIRIKNIVFNVHNNGIVFHEFLHTIKSIGVNGLEIENCTFNDFWGDAICLSHYGDGPKTGERTRNQNVIILNNTIIGGNHHNNRNGISIVNGENVLVKGNVIKNTSRKNMPGGIDIEPNNSAYTIKNIRIEKNELEGIQGISAIKLMIANGSSAHSVTIDGNRIKDCRFGIAVAIKTHNTTDGIVISNNFVDDDTRPYSFSGKGSSSKWTIANNTFLRPSLHNIPGNINVTNLVMKDNKKKE